MLADEFTLLDQYATDRSQDAYRQLVERYAGLVYTAARRQVRNSHLAEDVTQAVFIVLSRKASAIRRGQPLSAWLLTTTRYTSINALRLETHRLERESRAAQVRSEVTNQQSTPHDSSSREELAGMLDEAIARLKGQDRAVVLLRFFEQKSLRDIGATLGISEEAAQKRISRAVDRLRDFFTSRGASVTAGALVTFLMSRATEAAPANLMAAISSGQTGAFAAQLVKGAITMSWVHKAVVAVVIALALAGTVVAGIFLMKAQNAPAGAAQSPATGAAAPTSAASPDKWTATFAGGAKVELVGLGDFGGAARWWAPDGTTLPDPGFDPRDNAELNTMRNTRQIQLLFRFISINDPDRQPRVFVNEAGMQVANWQGDWQHHSDLNQVIAAVPNANAQVSVRVGLPKGEFIETVLLDLNGAPPAADLPVTIGAINADADGGSGIEVQRMPMDLRDRRTERRIIVVTRDGKRFQPRATIALEGGRGQLMHFKCAKEQIDRIIFATRTIEWMLIKNVSTIPIGSTPTAVQISPLANP